MHFLLICFFVVIISYVAIVLALYILSSQIPAAGFYGRVLTSFACLIACACYGVVASAGLRLVGYGGLSQWTVARAFKWTMRYTTGVEFVVQGEEHLRVRPAVFIGNHQTELDVLALGSIFPPYCSVTAKKQLKWVPVLGWFMALSKTVFIDRANRETARAVFDNAARQMKTERQSVYIFVEGTRSYTTRPELLPFKKGAFHLAVQAGVPVVPIVIANYSNVLHMQSRHFVPGKIPVKVLPAIPTNNLTSADVDGLTERVRNMMLEELITLTELARAQNIAVSESQAQLLDEAGVAKASGSDVHRR